MSVDKKDAEADHGSVEEVTTVDSGDHADGNGDGHGLEDTQRRRRKRSGLRIPSDNVPRPQQATMGGGTSGVSAVPTAVVAQESRPMSVPVPVPVPVPEPVPIAAKTDEEEDLDVDLSVDDDDDKPTAVVAKPGTNGSGPHVAKTAAEEEEELADDDLVEDRAAEQEARARTDPGTQLDEEDLESAEIEEVSAGLEKAAADAAVAEVRAQASAPVSTLPVLAAEKPHAPSEKPADKPLHHEKPASPPIHSAPVSSVPTPIIAAASGPVTQPPQSLPPPKPPAQAFNRPSGSHSPSNPALPAVPPPAATSTPGVTTPHRSLPPAPPPAAAQKRNSNAAAAAAAAVADPKPKKRKGRAWYEEIFDDDYLRTLPFLTPQATQREAGFLVEGLAIKPGQQVLDLGCGYGRHAMELAARGYHVVALDLSLPLLLRGADEAQRRGLTINFVHGDMRELTFDSQFDGAYCVFSTFGFFDDETNKRVAQNMARALKPGARLVIDVLNRDYIVADLPTRVWWEGDGCVVLEEVDFNYYTSRLVSNRSVVFEDGRQLEQEISIRAYALHELGKLLHQAGFRVLEVSGNLAARGRFFGNHSRHLIIVAEKRSDRSSDSSRDLTPPPGSLPPGMDPSGAK